MQPSEICIVMTGDGTHMIQSREAIGLEIKTPFIICVSKHQMPFMSSSLTDFPFQEPKKVKFINEPLEDNLVNTAKVNNS